MERLRTSSNFFLLKIKVIVAHGGKNLTPIFEYIERVVNNGGAILIHSRKGMNRCVTLGLAYLMQKYNWTLSKAERYYKSKVNKEDFYEVKEWFLQQLREYEKYLREEENRNLTDDFIFVEEVNTEEQMMVNTWINSQNKNYGLNKLKNGKSEKKRKSLVWHQDVVQLIPFKENLDIDIHELMGKSRGLNRGSLTPNLSIIDDNHSKRGSTPANLCNDIGKRIKNLKSIIHQNKNSNFLFLKLN